MAEPLETEEKLDSLDIAEADLASEYLGRTDDPVRMYLREMGMVPLLTREDEVSIAKRIESGRLKMLKAITQTPIASRELIGFKERLMQDKREQTVQEDDIAIDGWFIVQRRQREDDRKENEKNKLPETEEVFVMVNSQKEADHVYNMNTEQGKRLHNTKLREAKEKGSMNESEFSQTKQQNQMAANRATFERFKR